MNTNGLHVAAMEVRNFLAIQEASLSIGKVARFEGKNGAGKTSFIKAVSAAFKGAGADVINLDADRAEVLVRLTNEWIQTVGAQRVTDHVQNTIQRKSVQVDLEYYDNAAYYDTLHRAQEEAPDRPANVVNNLVRIAQGGISLLAMAGLLISFHPGLAVILMLSIVPGLMVRLHHANRMHGWHKERAPKARVAWYLNYLLTGETHAKEIRMFGLGDLLIRRFCRIRDKLRSEKFELAGRRSMSEFLARSELGSEAEIARTPSRLRRRGGTWSGGCPGRCLGG